MKEIYKVVIILVIIAILSACQPTPDKPIIIGKNGGLESSINKTAVPQMSHITIQEAWVELLEFQRGVQVIIDAKIDKPKVEEYPVIEVKPHEFTQAEAEKFIDLFMQGQPIYEYKYIRTKADIEQDIIMARSYLEEAKSKTNKPELEYQANIDIYTDLLKQLEEEYNQAPENTLAPKPAIVKLDIVDDSETDVYKSMQIQSYVNDSKAYFKITILNNLESHMLFLNTDIIYNDEYSIEATGAINELNIKKEEAQKKAEDTLREMGMENMELESTKVLFDLKNIDNPNDNSSVRFDPSIKKFYAFYFSRVNNGIPITNIQPCYGMQSDNTENINYAQLWHPEDIMIGVDDRGTIIVRWNSPGDVVRVVNENVQLMDFEEIKEIFRKQMFYQRTWTFPGIQENGITIKTIKLGYMRVKVKDENKYYMLPVWDFIGDWTYTVRSQENSIENVSFLTLNAIDGSVIDRNLGY